MTSRTLGWVTVIWLILGLGLAGQMDRGEPFAWPLTIGLLASGLALIIGWRQER